MSNSIKCHSCGADDAAELMDESAVCKYCGVVLFERPFAQWNMFARSGTSATGNNTWSYVRNGISVIVIFSLVACYLDNPGWLNNEFAIAIWMAILPLLTLVWAFNLHPQKRIPFVILGIILANSLPFLIGVMIKEPRRMFSDDLWGISAFFSICSLTGFVFGALMNNYRKRLLGIYHWFKGGNVK